MDNLTTEETLTQAYVTTMLSSGKYTWSNYDINEPSLDDGNKSRFIHGLNKKYLLFTFSSEKYKKEASLIFHIYSSPELFIYPIILGGYIKLKPHVQKYFEKIQIKESIEKFGFYPIKPMIDTEFINKCKPQSLFLYGYLATLKRKKVHSVENTPIKLKEYLNEECLSLAYEDLEKHNLLESKTSNSWIHNLSSEAIEFRQNVIWAVSYSGFIRTAELMTSSVKEEVKQCIDYEWKMVSEEVENRKYCPCPICSTVPNRKVYLPLDDSIIFPFHYHCGIWGPELETD